MRIGKIIGKIIHDVVAAPSDIVEEIFKEDDQHQRPKVPPPAKPYNIGNKQRDG